MQTRATDCEVLSEFAWNEMKPPGQQRKISLHLSCEVQRLSRVPVALCRDPALLGPRREIREPDVRQSVGAVRVGEGLTSVDDSYWRETHQLQVIRNYQGKVGSTKEQDAHG